MSAPPATRRPRFLPWLLLLFVGSGCAALIYEIVWFQLLQLVVGASAVALGVLLGTFMGGMCLGSLLLPRLVSPRCHPLRVYAMLEAGIGIIGIAILLGLPKVVELYAASVGHGLAGVLARGGLSAVCLLPPTLLMGATLPAIARWVEALPTGVSWLGFFYGGNIAGGVVGCLLAGFYLLRVYDMPTATAVAVAINAAVALLGFSLAALTPSPANPGVSLASSPRVESVAVGEPAALAGMTCPRSALPVYLAIALSGFCALSAEVVWTRQLSLLLGGTVYTFSIILAVFLIGLGLGSSVGAALSRGPVTARRWLGGCQGLLAGAIAWSAFMVARSLPEWPVDPSLSKSPWFNFQLDLVRCGWAILPAAFLWGASFPLALAASLAPGRDACRVVGQVYAANTAGAILGALSSSVLLIRWLGTQQIQRLLIGLSAVAALLLVVALRPALSGAVPARRRFPTAPTRLAAGLGWVAALAVCGWLAWSVPPVPKRLIAYGRFTPTRADEAEIIYFGEGMNSSVAVSEVDDGTRYFHVSGKVEASTEPQDMRLQRLLGHLPALFHPHPRKVLVVGCGAGVTAGTFLLHPEIERIVICELEPLIPRVVATYFAWENHDVLKDPRVEIIFDDARHYLLTAPEQFDIITSDPIHPWVKGAAALYTREYFDLCRRHLTPGGIVTQWVPLYESSHAAVRSEMATFFAVFPDGTIWSNEAAGRGYDVVLLAQNAPLTIDVDALQRRLDRKDHLPVTLDLDEIGLKSAVDLLATYGGRGPDLKPWLQDAELNRDRNLRLQYLAGLGLNATQSGRIYSEMLAYRRFPDELIAGSDTSQKELRRRLGNAK